MGGQFLSPMDGFRFFETPKVLIVNEATDGQQILPVNVRRVMVLFAAATGSRVSVLPVPPVMGVGAGIQASPDGQPLVFTYGDHPALVQGEWYQVTATGGMVVVEVLLREWPQGQLDL